MKAEKKSSYLTVFNNCVLVLLAYFYSSHTHVPESELGKRIFSGVFIANFLGFIAGSVVTYIRCPQRSFYAVLYGAVAASLSLMLVGFFVDDAINHPDKVLVFLISILIFVIVYKSSVYENSKISHLSESRFGTDPSLFKVQTKQQRHVSEVDRRTIAAHEAGHALLYAALGCLPDDFHIKIKSTEDDSNSLGYVSGLRLEHCLNYKTESEWYMLVLLAGKKGERSMGLQESLGASGDMRVWLDLASQYLENQYRGLYYPSPSSDAQRNNNKAELEALKTEQNYLLDSFFAINKRIHNELASELLQQGSMKREQIKTYLDRVEFPASFPQLPHLVRSK